MLKDLFLLISVLIIILPVGAVPDELSGFGNLMKDRIEQDRKCFKKLL